MALFVNYQFSTEIAFVTYVLHFAVLAIVDVQVYKFLYAHIPSSPHSHPVGIGSLFVLVRYFPSFFALHRQFCFLEFNLTLLRSEFSPV